MFTVTDLQELQTEHPDWQMELVDGSIVVMRPSDYESEEVGLEFARQLANWVRPRKLGRVTGSSAGFILPTTDPSLSRDLRDPDVSFVKAERLKKTKRDFVQMVPDLTVEVKSKTDRVKVLVEKIQLFLELGSTVGVSSNPDERTVTVYRLGQNPIVLRDSDRLTLPDLLPGWELVVSDLWPPEFD
ncbi:Uma2 family endonuclease [Scytonema sp. NUACC26]|uniref:Uma2 family endonuclease n=1 Tax=Scytonema sp. NUACC26 TaxID=3140176 RepID=UPI0034DB8556